jgi:y4mF family transcriptional regulator
MAMPAKQITNAEEFGAAVREARRREHLTQRQLALSVGAGERFIVDLESGKETTRLGKAIAVATALGIKLVMTHEN